jgi:tight adherence protein C
MAIIIAMGTFFTVFLTVYGLALRSETAEPMDARLGGLRYSRPKREAVPEQDPAFKARVLAPLLQSMSARVQSILPSSITDRLQMALVQAGLKIRAGQFIVIVGILAGAVPLLMASYMLLVGSPTKTVVMMYLTFLALGAVGPRFWLLGRIKKRQKEIWKSLPDAFDLITASVEAGLGIDAAFTRVIEKVKGPFAVELARTMREITVGRSRRDAFLDMTDRTGVEELRSLVNSIIQAEAMGISIGTVIRVQTGVIRMKRRQKAEQQAFKAPIKMVFPLVFFIFPAIMVVIGGPAAIQIMNSGW